MRNQLSVCLDLSQSISMWTHIWMQTIKFFHYEATGRLPFKRRWQDRKLPAITLSDLNGLALLRFVHPPTNLTDTWPRP